MSDLRERLAAALADRYTIESEVGRGGMAVVFRAADLRHDREVAVKVLRPGFAASIGAERFLREIEIVTGLAHPFILPIFDSGEADGLLYYVMPCLEGESLRDRVEWIRVNRDAMKQVRMRPSLGIHALLQKHQEEIIRRYTDELRENVPSYQAIATEDHEWNHRVILRHLCSAVRTRERIDFLSYCGDLTRRRLDQGFSPRDLIRALEILDSICVDVVTEDPEGHELVPYLYPHVSMTVLFGIDKVRDICERMRDRYPELIPKGCEDD